MGPPYTGSGSFAYILRNYLYANGRHQLAKKRFDVEIPDGQHLGLSRDTDGAYRAHLFADETNDLVGHAELFEPDEDNIDSPHIQYVYVQDHGTTEDRELTPEEIARALETLIYLGIIVAKIAVEVAPDVKRWWDNTAIVVIKAGSNQVLSTMKSTSNKALVTVKSMNEKTALTVKSTFKKLPGTRRFEREAAPAKVNPTTEPRGTDLSTELAVSYRDYQTRMSGEEARDRFVAALVTKAFSEEQMRILRNVRIEDDGGVMEVEAAMEELTPQQVRHTLASMLEKNPLLRDPKLLAELGTTLGVSRANGENVVLRIGQT